MASIKIKGDTSGEITLSVPAAAGTNTITFPAETGNVLTDGSALPAIDGSALTGISSAHEILHVVDAKGATTYGGGASANTTQTRDLNTVVTNDITGASLSSNQFTLPAGTYFIDATAPANEVDRHRISLYNVTDTTTTLMGLSAAIGASISTTHARLRGKFTISGSKVFEIRHYTLSARTVYGLGDYTNDGSNSRYTEVVVQKV